MTTVPPVEKMGSLWKAQVVAVGANGNLLTNLRNEDVAPLAQKSKVWFEIGLNTTTVRGLYDSATEAPTGRLAAIQGLDGFVEITIVDGDAAKATNLAAGSPVTVNFRT
jgi:S-adenosylmethionine hydrolase